MRDIFHYTCEHCGAEFESTHQRAKYCSARCKRAAKDARYYAAHGGANVKRRYKRAKPSAAGLLRAERRAGAVAAAEKRRAMMARLAERDRAFAEWAGESGKPRQREFRPKDIHGISVNDMRRWY